MFKYLAILLLALSLTVGCGSVNQTAFKTTTVTITMVNVAEDYWGDLVRAGKATDAQQAKIRDLVNKYDAVMAVYQSAIDAYYDGGKTDGSALTKAAQAASDSRATLFNAVLAFLPADQQANLNAEINRAQ